MAGVIEVSEELREWVESIECVVGTVMHTFDGETNIKATKTDTGWVYEKESE